MKTQAVEGDNENNHSMKAECNQEIESLKTKPHEIEREEVKQKATSEPQQNMEEEGTQLLKIGGSNGYLIQRKC